MKFYKDTLFKGAFILTIGGLLTKILGVIYRIPLTNMLGDKGMGIYQSVFPLYCLLLTISSTGIPSGISKIIASGKNPKNTFKKSLKIFLPIGFIGSLFMFFLSTKISAFQGESLSKYSYMALSPSVFFVSIISCFRGLYQGLIKMKYTAISQMLEQLIKLTFGLILVTIFKNDVVKASVVAILSVTIAEFLTLIYFIIVYKRTNASMLTYSSDNISVKLIFLTIFPIMLSTIILPSLRTIDSFLILNILNTYKQNATALYGIYSGVIESIIGVPVTLCYGIGVTCVPLISKELSKNGNYKKYIKKSIIYTLILAVIFAILTYAFSSTIINILYPKLSNSNKTLSIKLLKLSSLSILFLPLMQTTASTLLGASKIYFPSISCLIGGAFKIIFIVILLKKPTINIFAGTISDIICYFVACFLNLVYIRIVVLKNKGKNEDVKRDSCCKPWLFRRRFNRERL